MSEPACSRASTCVYACTLARTFIIIIIIIIVIIIIIIIIIFAHARTRAGTCVCVLCVCVCVRCQTCVSVCVCVCVCCVCVLCVFACQVSNLHKGVDYKLNLVNMTKSKSLYNKGLRPLTYSEQRLVHEVKKNMY